MQTLAALVPAAGSPIASDPALERALLLAACDLEERVRVVPAESALRYA